MKMGRKGLIAVAVLGSWAVASIPATADGGPPRGYSDQVSYPSIWQGLYAGVHVGFGDGDRVLDSAQVSHNRQAGRVACGIEADFAGSSIEEEASACLGGLCAHVSASLDGLATVRGRIGYRIDPRTLPYAT